jgi:hypothetical protein
VQLIDALQKAFGSDFDSNSHHLVSHGIELPADTPVLWMAKNLCYPDNFVHVVCRKRMEETGL